MHLPSLIHDLAIILGVAAIVTFIFQRIRQPVVLGYILAGFIVGPHTPSWFSVSDRPNITTWAELGVIFLMFSLGLEFSFRRLGKVGASAGMTALFETSTMSLLGFGAGKLLGWTTMEAVFLGCMVAISSTTVILKALGELGLKKKKFAERVFGILIVEDLVAILMLVALTNIVLRSSVGPMDLLIAAFKLAIVVGAWFVLGMFAVPNLVKAVSKHGTNETLILVALGLCLALVTISAQFDYSVALGAFIMGALIAESREVHRVEALLEPLRDVFGAVFFVSIGMLLDPKVIMENLGVIAGLSLLIIGGKFLAVTTVSLLSGQTLANAVQVGLSLGQIGEFSFIIATLGLNYQVIDPKLYPIVVATSLFTTFTTPYMMRLAPGTIRAIERFMPQKAMDALYRYEFWLKARRSGRARQGTALATRQILKWLANAVVVITIFELVKQFAFEPLDHAFVPAMFGHISCWALAFVFSLPFIWGMSTVLRPKAEEEKLGPTGGWLFLSQILTVVLVGLLSTEFLPFRIAVALSVAIEVVLFLLFWQKIDGYYHWFEDQFAASFHDKESHSLDKYAPWDMFLVEMKVEHDSALVGLSLRESQLREKYDINVVVIRRGNKTLVAPRALEQIYPGDVLLCTSTEDEIQRMLEDQKQIAEAEGVVPDLESYQLLGVHVQEGSEAVGQSIRTSNLSHHFASMVVGMERANERVRNPSSETLFTAGDFLWLVGPDSQKRRLAQFFEG